MMPEIYSRNYSQLVDRLAELYKTDYVAVAKICDEVLDRSGSLLGDVRTRHAELKAEISLNSLITKIASLVSELRELEKDEGMKVVINKCFGGFSLSPLAQKEYLKLKGKECFFYKQTKYDFQNKGDEYTRLDELEADFYSHTFTKDFGKIISNLSNDDSYFHSRDIERTDPDLIAVVEKLGDKVNGQCSKLSVVEIPDNVEWEISEYDGNETIEEKHRSWS